MVLCLGGIFAPPGAGKTFERLSRERALLEQRGIRIYDTDTVLPFVASFSRVLAQSDFQSACGSAAADFADIFSQIRQSICLTNSLEIALALQLQGAKVCSVCIDEAVRARRLQTRDGNLRSYEPLQTAAGRVFDNWNAAFDFIIGGFHGNHSL